MRPILACHTHCYGRFGAQAAVVHVRAAGIDWLELPIQTAGQPTRYGDEPLLNTAATPDDVRRVGALLHAHGVQLASCDICTGNPVEPAIADLICLKLDLAHSLGVQTVVGDAGDAHTEADREQLFANLRRIGDYAARLGCIYCLDTQPGICVNHRWMLDTMERLRHPAIRLNFDTGALLYYNDHVDGEVALAKVCHLVRHVHLKDTSGEFGRWYFPALGAGGAVNFVRVQQILRDVGFAGPRAIKIDGIEGAPLPDLAGCQQRLVDSLATLRKCGF